MKIEFLLLILLIIFFSHIIQTITGFAGSMLALPFLTFIIPIDDAKTLITLVGILWSIWILYTDHKFIDLKFLTFIAMLMIAGILVGTVFVNLFPTTWLLLVMGVMIIGSAIYNLVPRAKVQYPGHLFSILLSLGAGVMQGMVLMGGPLLVILTNAHFTDRRYYRATLAALWIIINTILIIIFHFNNTLHTSMFILTLLCILPLILAIWLGNILNNHLNHRRFNLLVNGLLIFAGVTVLVQGLN